MMQAVMLFFRGAFAHVRLLCEESQALSREVGDNWTTAVNLHYLGWTAYSQGEYMAARRFSEESITLLKALGNPGFTTEALTVLAEEMLTLGDESTAASLLGEVLTRAKGVGNQLDIAQVLHGLGLLALHQGNRTQARELFEESITAILHMRSRSPKSRCLLASCLEEVGKIALTQGQAAWTVLLLSAAEALRIMNGSLSPVWKEQPFYEQTLLEARMRLGQETFAALWAEGLAMTPEEALAAEGRSVPNQSAQTATQSLSPLLTKREMEVLRLLVEGLTNAQIAERLRIRIPTVNTHVESIYSKLGVSSRSAATRYAIEQHLL
jgi:DNA-binding CsgD family transcriptional regulator